MASFDAQSLMQSAFKTLGGDTAQAGIQSQTDNLAQGSQYQATTQAFDEDKGVAGRINSMLQSGSPLMETARTRAAQSMNGRGLNNSSMAVQAGQQAMIDSAAPIASADAQLYSQQALANQSATNDAAKQNAQLRTSVGVEGMKLGEGARQYDGQMGLERDKLTESARQFDVNDASTNSRFNAELSEKGRQFDAGEQNKLNLGMADINSRVNMNQLDNQTKVTLGQLDAQSKVNVATLENNWRIELSRNEKIAGAWGTLMEQISKIQGNKDLDSNAKQQLIQQNLDLFNGYASFAKQLGDNPVDISDLLSFTTEAPAQPKSGSSDDPTLPSNGGGGYYNPPPGGSYNGGSDNGQWGGF